MTLKEYLTIMPSQVEGPTDLFSILNTMADIYYDNSAITLKEDPPNQLLHKMQIFIYSELKLFAENTRDAMNRLFIPQTIDKNINNN